MRLVAGTHDTVPRTRRSSSTRVPTWPVLGAVAVAFVAVAAAAAVVVVVEGVNHVVSIISQLACGYGDFSPRNVSTNRTRTLEFQRETFRLRGSGYGFLDLGCRMVAGVGVFRCHPKQCSILPHPVHAVVDSIHPEQLNPKTSSTEP